MINLKKKCESLKSKILTKAKDFKNVTGYQFTVSWDAEVLELLNVHNQSLQGYFGKQRTGEGYLITSWDDEWVQGVSLNDDATLFELKFKAIGVSGTSTEIKIGSELTSSEAYNQNLDLLDIISTNGMVKVGDVSNISNLTSNISNLSVQPNPFSNSTQIIFNLTKEENVTLSIYDLVGKEVWRMNGEFKTGENNVEWQGKDSFGNQLSSGLYHIRLVAGKQSNSERILIIGR